MVLSFIWDKWQLFFLLAFSFNLLLLYLFTFIMNYLDIKTVAQLKEANYQPKTIKQEVRNNLIKKLQQNKETFSGILGYEDSVIPDVERALLSQHNILFLGLRGQAKTRMARQMVDLLDDYIPIVKGSKINDDPFNPISKFAKQQLQNLGDDTSIEWLHKSQRYGEKLATPDVSVADLIGDIDPIKAANLKLSFDDEGAIHYGIIPHSNRCIFVINELPDLQARIQVALFNILQEGDVQIRGFKLRIPLDILFVFTANPEDYTNRGSIVTPLKDRIESQILTHYPKSIETALAITQQEANLLPEQQEKVVVSDLVKRIIEQIAFEARASELVDKKSGVSARLTIAALENAVSSAERRSLKFNLPQTQVWISDVFSTIAAINGKIELLYEGEQEGPYQVALHLINKSIRTCFLDYFPNPEEFKKKRSTGKKSAEEKPVKNPYQPIIDWFGKGNEIILNHNDTDLVKAKKLNAVTGLSEFIAQYYAVQPTEELLLKEFILHGLAAHSLLSKKLVDNEVSFKDLMGGMMDWNNLMNNPEIEDNTDY